VELKRVYTQCKDAFPGCGSLVLTRGDGVRAVVNDVGDAFQAEITN